MKTLMIRSILPVLAAAVLLPPLSASAQTSEWQNTTNSNWSTGTWNPSAPTATGTAIIQGTGTAIVNAGASITVGAAYVGYSKVGALLIQGRFQDTNAIIGYNDMNNGSNVTVSGTGFWNNTGQLVIGNIGAGSAELNIAGSGSVASATSILGNDRNSSGVANISGMGNWNAGNLTLGAYASSYGAIHITGSGLVSSTNATIASGSGRGEVTIADNGKWQTSGLLTVGGNGDGSFTISDNGSGTSGTTVIGSAGSGTGRVILNDAAIFTTSLITIGASGTGQLAINNNAIMTSTNARIALNSGNGSVEVTGSGYWQIASTLYMGGDVNSRTTVGNSYLTITNSGSVKSDVSYIGYFGNTATVIVTDSGFWDSGNLYIASFSTGNVTVSGQGYVASQYAKISDGDVNASGAVKITESGSWSVTTRLEIGRGGALLVTDNGFLHSQAAGVGISGNQAKNTVFASATVSGSGFWLNDTDLKIGDKETGSLNILASGSVASNNTIIGDINAGSGTVSISGSGLLANSGTLIVANSGSGALIISDSGSAVNQNTIVGANSEASGTVIVSDNGLLASNGALIVANSGSGVLIISDSGSVTAQNTVLGANTGASGTVTVSDNSLFSVSDTLTVGANGSGELVLADSARAALNHFSVGNGAGSGTVTVSGQAVVTGSGRTAVGDSGSGVLTVTERGVFNTTGALIGASSGGAGGVTVTDSGVWNDSGTAWLGFGANASGSVTVSGSGRWQIQGDLMNGGSGTGALELANDGNVIVGGTYVQSAISSLNLVLGDSTAKITADSAVLSGWLNIVGFSGTITEKASTTQNARYLILHTVSGITNDFLDMNFVDNAPDYITGNRLIVGGTDYWVGLQLTWYAGGTVSHGTFTVGDGQTFDVDIPLDDVAANPAKNWSGDSLVKDGGGTLILSALNNYSGTTTVSGGTLAVTGTIAGNAAGQINGGIANVSGQGLWNVERLDIGGGGGRLAITGQGRVQSADTVIANAAGEQGSMTVSGNGVWSGGTLTVGGAGNGTLTLSDRGTVSADELLLARDAGSSGTLTVTSDAVRLTSTSSGRLAVSGGAGDGAVVFDHRGNFIFDSTVTGSVNLALASGTTTFTATNSDQRGTVSVSAGAMLRAGAANVISPNAEVVINSGGFYQLNNFTQNLSRLASSGGTVDFGGTGGALTVGTLSGNGTWLFHANTETGARSSVTVSNGSSGTERVILQLTGNGTADPAQVLSGMINDPYQAVWQFDDFNWGLFDYSANYQNGALTVRRNGTSVAGAVIGSVSEIQRRAWFAQQNSLLKRMGDVRLSLTPPQEDGAAPDADDDEWNRRIDRMFADMGIKMQPRQNTAASLSAPEQKLSQSFIENVWIRAYGSQLNVSRKVSGMAYDQIVYGSDVGTDHAWRLDARNTLLTGLYAGFGGSQADFKTGGVKAELTGYHGGLYASWWNTSGWYVDATLKGAMIDNKTSAPVAGSMARASFSNMEIGGSVEVGRRFNLGGGWFIEPQAQLNYMHLMAKDFQHGSLNIGARDMDAVEFRVGAVGGRTVRLSGDKLVQTYVKLSGVGEASSGGHISNGVQTLRASSDGAKVEVGGGLIFQIDTHNQLHLDYEAEFGEKYTQPWGLTGGYRYQF